MVLQSTEVSPVEKVGEVATVHACCRPLLIQESTVLAVSHTAVIRGLYSSVPCWLSPR